MSMENTPTNIIPVKQARARNEFMRNKGTKGKKLS